tara:strand:+ start:353 stop:1174 length:822 start_codon:yes stop_codon:yes gene_type:complete
MNKTFKKVFAKAKSENRACFVAFVTGMDPDYESSKEILIELSKYCDCIEIGVSFNTSTSDSSIIMSANDRAINSGAKTEKIFQLIKEVKSEITNVTAFVTMGYLNQIHVYGIDRYIKDCKKNGVDGCIVVDSNNDCPEDEQIYKGLNKNDIAYIKLIAPTNDDKYIKQSLKKCSSWIYVVSYAGVTGTKDVNIVNVKKLVKMIRKQSKIPIGVGFGIKTVNDVKSVSKLADLTVCGSSIVNKINEGHQNGLSNKNLGKFVGDYVKSLSQGVKS